MTIFLFDVEGTLVDTAQEQLTSWQDTLRAVGCDVPRDVLQRVSGMDGNDLAKAVAPELTYAARKHVVEKQGRDFESRFLDEATVFPGMQHALRALHHDGARLGLATDSEGKALKTYLRLMDIDDVLEIVASGDEVAEGKPNPRLIQHALSRLHVNTGEGVYMVGDTPSDAYAARGAGATPIGLLSGGFSREALKAADCRVVLQGIGDLPAWFRMTLKAAPDAAK